MTSYGLFLLVVCICVVPGRAVFADSASAVAVEGIIEGIPVPEGSVFDGNTYFQGDDGVEMASYSHPKLSGKEVLQFYDVYMPQWGWEKVEQNQHRLQRSYTNNGVPVLIGVDKKKMGSSFNILKGVSGDWGYIPSLRPE